MWLYYFMLLIEKFVKPITVHLCGILSFKLIKLLFQVNVSSDKSRLGYVSPPPSHHLFFSFSKHILLAFRVKEFPTSDVQAFDWLLLANHVRKSFRRNKVACFLWSHSITWRHLEFEATIPRVIALLINPWFLFQLDFQLPKWNQNPRINIFCL